MITAKSMLARVTDPGEILRNVREVLSRIDPSFSEIEQKYLETAESLRDALGESDLPSIGGYIEAEEKKICTELLYVGWLGFMQNLECFENPVNAIFLKLDYEQLHREDRMDAIPEVQRMQKIIDSFHGMIYGQDKEKQLVTEGVREYICYLQTTGYKLAHYFGFVFADQFLQYVIPGYRSNQTLTMQYERELSQYLKLDLMQLR